MQRLTQWSPPSFSFSFETLLLGAEALLALPAPGVPGWAGVTSDSLPRRRRRLR
jgi:hypothetical protein